MPYNWGIQPLIFDKTRAASDRTTWSSEPKYKGKVMIPTMPTSHCRWWLLPGNQPFNWTSKDLLRSKVGWVASLADPYVYHQLQRSGEHDGRGEAVIGCAQTYLFVNKYKKLVCPSERNAVLARQLLFLEASHSKPGCHEFVNYTLQPRWQCNFANETNQNGILSRSVAKKCFKPAVWNGAGGNLVSRMSPAIMKKMVLFQPVEDFDKRLELWNEFKAG
jgi:spermidine/putrescine transport system substrate-binding protein